MTKFPLPASTFLTLELPQKDIGEIEALSSLLVEKTLGQYHEHEVVRRGVVNTTRWKRVKQREDITVYKERANGGAEGSFDRNTVTPSYGSAIPVLMGIGTIAGDLHDVMYGVLNATTEAMRIKSSYAEEGFLDGAVLATLIKPSIEDPLRSLTLRWCVKRNPIFMKPVVRMRDVVYIESTGIAYIKSGERIGYQLLHSVELPGVHELTEYQIVRANVSFCYVYRQKTPETVDVFMRGILNPLGDVPPSVSVMSAAEALVSVSTNVHCAEMKKLMWLVRTAKSIRPVMAIAASQCGICSQPFGSALSLKSSKKCCAVCLDEICSKCRVSKKLSFISSLTYNEVSQTKFSFCTRCVKRAFATSAIEIAADEINDIRATFDESLFLTNGSDMTSPTSFSSDSGIYRI
uniref:FYVE-type domain-containing protein n=1 Tax=Globisporangium ultimum (strain ATCC 200006 / CBS 805.95 / DAOM BR144) TaxID=431595 RepID=K3W6C4_GLOUD